MIDLSDARLFTPMEGPEQGLTIHVLTRKVAPVQQGFYFVNDGMSADGRYLWFYCAFPPAERRSLGVADFDAGEVRHFPETQFGSASPLVDAATGEVYWQCGRNVWKRGPQQDAQVQLVNAIPEELLGSRHVKHEATHLTKSADGKELFIDLRLELQVLFGSLPLDGGDFRLWHRFDRNFNHAQFSPTDPDTVLFAQENHNDPITGLTLPITNRLWLLRRGEEPRPILPEPRRVTHEWWDSDGEHVWCVWGNDTWRVRSADGETEKIEFPRHCWHSHSSVDGRFIVGDSNDGFFRGCASTVHFMNRATGKVLVLARHPERKDFSGLNYHIDPHPRFCCGDRFVVFTTLLRNEIDVAIVRTAELVERTS